MGVRRAPLKHRGGARESWVIPAARILGSLLLTPPPTAAIVAGLDPGRGKRIGVLMALGNPQSSAPIRGSSSVL
jgi:hypothetical protein